MTMPSSAHFSLVDLVPGYPGKPLFHKLNISAKSSSLICLLGSNGSGKSTLIKTIAGLHKPLSGDVVFATAGIVSAKSVAVVLTDAVQVPSMTVRELITYGRYPYLNWNIKLLPQDQTLIQQSMAQVNIDDLADRRIDELSDGQRQMVLIARALAQNTPVLLLDEPTSHLDLVNRVMIMRFLKELSRTTQKAIVIATHEIELAVQLADKLWLAHDHQILEGFPEDMMLNGTLEKAFTINGYDLSSGKIAHVLHKKISINLVGGDDHSFRWTKNALERNGYAVNESGHFLITINIASPWSWSAGNSTVDSLDGLVAALNAMQR